MGSYTAELCVTVDHSVIIDRSEGQYKAFPLSCRFFTGANALTSWPSVGCWPTLYRSTPGKTVFDTIRRSSDAVPFP